MGQTTSWVWLERSVLNRLNLLAGETAAASEATFTKTPPLTAADLSVSENRWPLSALRAQIVDVVLDIARQICENEADPRRLQYRQTTSVANFGLLPTSAGGYGSFIHTDGDGVKRSLEQRAVSHLRDIANFPTLCNAGVGTLVYGYAIDGNTLISSVTPVTVEHFDFTAPATDAASLTTLFSDWLTIAPMPDEFREAAASGSAGLLALNAGSLVEDVARYLDVYRDIMTSRGLKPTLIDLPAKPKA